MAFSFARPLAWVTFAGLVLVGSGCSLLNPYVRASELDASPITPSLVDAVAVAQAQRKAYYGAVSDRAKLRNGLPLVLVPLGAAAAYKGLVGDAGESTRKLLLKEGLVGASLFGLGSHFTSTTREQTYLAGAKALSCAIYASSPYYLLNALSERVTLENIEAFAKMIAALEASSARSAGDPREPFDGCSARASRAAGGNARAGRRLDRCCAPRT